MDNFILMLILNFIVISYALILFIYGKYYKNKEYLNFKNYLHIDQVKGLYRSDSAIESQKYMSHKESINQIESLI